MYNKWKSIWFKMSKILNLPKNIYSLFFAYFTDKYQEFLPILICKRDLKKNNIIF